MHENIDEVVNCNTANQIKGLHVLQKDVQRNIKTRKVKGAFNMA